MPLPLKRIAVIGLAGSGKTTLAAMLARRLGGAHIELDRLHWERNWTPAATDVFRARTAEAVAAECWAADGNYSAVRDLVWGRADHIVWPDYDLARVQGRLLCRSLQRLWTGEEVCNGNRETIRARFAAGDSIFLYNRDAILRHRDLYPPLLAKQSTARVVHLPTPRETENWLNTFAPT